MNAHTAHTVELLNGNTMIVLSQKPYDGKNRVVLGIPTTLPVGTEVEVHEIPESDLEDTVMLSLRGQIVDRRARIEIYLEHDRRTPVWKALEAARLDETNLLWCEE
jgi:hypothetical protein